MRRKVVSIVCGALVAVAFCLAGCGGDGGSGNSTPTYSIYGNNLPAGSYQGSKYAGSWDNVKTAFNADGWTLIGSSTATKAFNAGSYTDFMIVPSSGVMFDSISCTITGTYAGNNINTSNISNYYNVIGIADGAYAQSSSNAYMVFDLPCAGGQINIVTGNR